jgi:hypothetical protein
MEKDSHSILDKAVAWSAHVLTASGGVIGLLALVALIHGDFQGMLLWLGQPLWWTALTDRWRDLPRSRKCCRA